MFLATTADGGQVPTGNYLEVYASRLVLGPSSSVLKWLDSILAFLLKKSAMRGLINFTLYNFIIFF